METNPVQYDETKIITLSSLEHIRKRPGMYIGRLGNGSQSSDGIYILLKELIDNSVDEYIMGYGKRIEINLNGTEVKVRDYGRGIPLGKLVECVSSINTGAKYNSEVFQFSVGLNGVGTKAVNALSEKFEVVSHREGKAVRASFLNGVLSGNPVQESTSERDGTRVKFLPDPAIFPKFSFDFSMIRKRLWNYAYLNRGLTLVLNGEKFKSERGLHDLLHEDCLIFQLETHKQSITVATNFSVVEQKMDHDFSNCSDLTPKTLSRWGRIEGTGLVLPPSGFFIAKH